MVLLNTLTPLHVTDSVYIMTNSTVLLNTLTPLHVTDCVYTMANKMVLLNTLTPLQVTDSFYIMTNNMVLLNTLTPLHITDSVYNNDEQCGIVKHPYYIACYRQCLYHDKQHSVLFLHIEGYNADVKHIRTYP